MKKYLVISAIVFITLCAAITLGLRSLDMEAMRPLVVQRISESLGQPVDIGRLSLRWKNGIFLSAENIVIYEDLNKRKPVLRLQEAGTSLGPTFFMGKQFQLPFEVTASYYSDQPNLRVKGILGPPFLGQKAHLEKITAECGLADLDLEKLSRVYVWVQAARLEGNLGGRLEAECQRMDTDEEAQKNMKATIHVRQGAVKMNALPSPFEKIQMEVLWAGDDLHIEKSTAEFARGTVELSGDLRDFRREGEDDLKLSLRDLSLDTLSSAGPWRAAGHVSLDVLARAQGGLNWPIIARSASGQGRFVMKDGALLDFNLFRTVVQKLSVIPGVENALENSLPDFYKTKLWERNTVFKPIEASFLLKDGIVFFDHWTLSTDLVSLTLTGQAGLDNSVRAQGLIRLDGNLSLHMVAAVPQLQLLANAEGELEIPVTVQGQIPHLSLMPDSDYLARKFFAVATRQLLASQLQNLGQ